LFIHYKMIPDVPTLNILFHSYILDRGLDGYREWKRKLCTRPGEYENFDYWAVQHLLHYNETICKDAPYMCCPLCREDNIMGTGLDREEKYIQRELNGEEIYPLKEIASTIYGMYSINIERLDINNKNPIQLPVVSLVEHTNYNMPLDKAIFPWWKNHLNNI
jgi:hypothetical protein